MDLLTQNSKIKKTSQKFGVRLFNFGITAYKSQKTGKMICPFADKCVKYCYAQKGAYIWSNVSPAFEKRYEATLREDFVEIMTAEIRKKRANFVRVHDSGDFYSPAYLQKWFDIAKQNPSVNFYAYTNSLNMVRGVERPDNFDFIFSDGGKLAHTIDQDMERHSKVFDTKEELLSAGYVDTSEYDLYATKWYNATGKVGLIKH
jgi:hypothetical protein